MQTRRKVVIIGSAFPLRGGLAAFNERLARTFLQQGDEVTIFTFSLQYPSFLFPGKTQYSDAPAPRDLDIRVCINSVNPLNWVRVGKKIRRVLPDLVIIKFWMPFLAPCLGTLAKFIGKNRHTRIVSILDNLIPHERRPGDRLLASYFIRHVHAFVVMSDSVRHDLESFNTTKPCIYCPHPLYDHFGDPVSKEEARRALGLEEEGRYLLFFGFIRDYKGLDLLLQAIDDERMKSLGVKLIVAGEFYTNPGPYMDIIRAKDLEGRVLMYNHYIPDGEVGRYFCAADVVVQPYKTATQSGVTQIAYHFNKPIITTDVGGLAEMVPDSKVGFVVRPDAEDILLAVLKYFRENCESGFSQNMQTEKTKYSWERMVDAIVQLS
jgi:glycosyltransferase involved in cell wall biosynthesis